METLYVVPTDCPHESAMLLSKAWGKGTVKEGIFRALSHRICLPKNLEFRYNRNLYMSWTCSGCTVGLGNEEQDCPQRQCGVGGKPLAGV
jgi:hypothetical protein